MDAQGRLGYYESDRDEVKRTVAWRAVNNACMAHFHSTIELMYVEEGELLSIRDGAAQLVGAGHMIVNSSYMVHSCLTPGHSRIIVATIPLSAVPSLKGLVKQHRFRQSIVDVRKIKECPRIMRMMSSPEHQKNEHFVNSLAQALLALLIEKIGLEDTADDTETDLIKRILLYMHKNAATPLSVAQAAAHFGYSAGRFSHIFNERIGASFTRHLNFLRCRMAQQLLKDGELSLIEVAGSCGFSSLRTFHRVYKGFTGNTPRGENIILPEGLTNA